MKDSFTKYLTIFFLLVYLVMQLSCIFPDDNKRQIVFILWFVCSYIAYTPTVKKAIATDKIYLLYFFLVFIGLSMLYKHTILYSISAVISFCSLFSPFLMYRILRTETRKIRRIIFIAITIILAMNFVTCLMYMLNSFTGTGLRDAEVMTKLKNTFFTDYAFAILVPYVVYYLLHRNKKGKYQSRLFLTILGYAICAALAFFVIKAQFMTAIVLMIMGTMLAFVYNRKRAKIVVPIVAVLSLLLFSAFSDNLIKLAEENDASATVQRIEELQNILENKSSDAEDFSLRQDLSKNSLQTFLENPIFGVFYKFENIMEAKRHGIGNHAEWFDTLAKYGLFGLLLIIFTIQVILRQRKVMDTNIHYVLFVVLGFLNPVLAFYLICMVFLYMPLLNNLIFKDTIQPSNGKV